MMIIGCDFHPSWQHGRCRPLSPWQTGGQLSGTDSARALLGRTAEAGSHHQAGQSHAAHAAGGSRANRSPLRSRVSPPQKPKAVAKVAAARKLAVRLYWMLRTQVAYPEIVRIESSPRVPLVGAS